MAKDHATLSDRRAFLRRAALLGGGAAAYGLLPAWALSDSPGLRARPQLSGSTFALDVSATPLRIDGKRGRGILVNGQLPAPLLRWREGDEVTLRVANRLKKSTSIHWHGILLPNRMDGVPGLTFPGIPSGGSFTYRFRLRQAGTYWYHSHSGLQEQSGHYGPIVIDPARGETVEFDREHVVVFSDWTFENPHKLFAKLKKKSHVYNRQHRTAREFFAMVRRRGLSETLSERGMWGDMRMDPTDIADVTAATYTYLVNGHGPQDNWTGLFKPGERVRLRMINASAMSIFNIRIPGLAMTVTQADGLDVRPVETDELQIGVAETFDVIVRPRHARAYALVAESNDRSGMGLATLAPRRGMRAKAPPLRSRPTLTMRDMAMDHGEHHGAHGGHGHHGDHGGHHEMGGDEMPARPPRQRHDHPLGPAVDGVAEIPANRLHERPLGLTEVPHRVLVYTDLASLERNPDTRAPERELELHLTGNMERYMWSFDGRKFSEVTQPIALRYGERVRVRLVNDTMMPHPIHLHGMFFDLVTEESAHKPRKHTVVVKPGEKMAFDVTANEPGDWAFHCHLLYHMHAGMMRVVRVGPPPASRES